MVIVKVVQGILKGGKSKTDSGFEYYDFLGVPYAKPPVGDLRFKSPQPPESWDNERDATKYDRNNTACQSDIMFGGTTVLGSEDCLYLNVSTPQLPSKESVPLPVIVYIHGGGFKVGNGIVKSEHGPDYLIEQNTVVVMINYRLSVFGFLSLDIPEAAGNMGLKDQVKALEWVRDNIEYFGGDKNNVTITGISAGSASVEYHILSPKSKGLFHKAILQSGSTLNHWAINFHPVDLARELVQLLDYKGSLEDQKAMHEFLLTIHFSNLSLAASQAIVECLSIRLFFGFVPTIEKDYGNDDAFLTAPPYKLLKEGNFNQVPVMRSFCNREGFCACAVSPNSMKNLIETKKFIDPYVHAIGTHDIESKKTDQYNLQLSSAYLGNTDNEIEKDIENFFGDIDFASGIWIAGKTLSLKVPVYMYQFRYAGKINYFKKLFGFNLEEPGAIHADDTTYVYKYESFQDGADENDLLVLKRVTTMITNFAKFGKPTLGKSDLIPVDWPQFTEESQMYLCIDKDLYLASNYESKKIAIFEELYDKSVGY